MKKDKYTVVIGLEIHIQLLTKSKIFSAEKVAYGELPNTHVSAISLAHPGTLPKVNKEAISLAIKMGLACQSTITHTNLFARKSYCYPDLPKGYQITQDTTPICRGGHVTIINKEGVEKEIPLTRIHLEEDTGKSLHGMIANTTLLDFNRAGTPLIELVTEPDVKTPEEAYQVLSEVRKLVRYLDICDGNMEEGSLRCDANVSVMPQGSTTFGAKVEVKNMNSMRNVQLAIEHEIDRQIALLEGGKEITRETRNFQASTGETLSMRAKEVSSDYRYFPEPDIPPVIVTKQWIEKVRATMPLLPKVCYEKFTTVYNLSPYTASVLTEQKDIALFFEALCQLTPHYTAAANWVIGPIKSHLNEMGFTVASLTLQPKHLASLIAIVVEDHLSFSIAANQLFPELLKKPDQNPLRLAEKLNLLHDSDETTLQLLVDDVMATYPDKVAAYRGGKKGLLGMLMGEVMKKSNGKAAPKLASKLLKKKIDQ